MGGAWVAKNESKAWAEKFFLILNVLLLVTFLGVFMGGGLYRRCNDKDVYAIVSASMALPNVIVPMFLVGKTDRSLPWHQRFVFKANLWNLIFGFIGNYLWTHYFYKVLGAKYTFDTYRLNDVPIPTYLATQSYFCLYHTISTIVLRVVSRSCAQMSRTLQHVCFVLVIAVLSYTTAYMETLTISSFIYYSFEDEEAMYKIGSAIYALYFIVSFPMFYRLDEDVTARRMSMGGVALDSFAAAMIVTLLLDFYRLALGPIYSNVSSESTSGVPFIS